MHNAVFAANADLLIVLCTARVVVRIDRLCSAEFWHPLRTASRSEPGHSPAGQRGDILSPSSLSVIYWTPRDIYSRWTHLYAAPLTHSGPYYPQSCKYHARHSPYAPKVSRVTCCLNSYLFIVPSNTVIHLDLQQANCVVLQVLERRSTGSALASLKSERQAAMEARFKHLLDSLLATDLKNDSQIRQLLTIAAQPIQSQQT